MGGDTRKKEARKGFLFLCDLKLRLFRENDVGVERQRQAVLHSRAQDHRMVARVNLQVVDVAPVRSVFRVFGNHFGVEPVGLEVVLFDADAEAVGAYRERHRHVVFRVGRANRHDKAELVERNLRGHGVYEIAGNLVAAESPRNLAGAETLGDFAVLGDELGPVSYTHLRAHET